MRKFAAVVMLSVACGGPDPHRTVLIDPTFTDEQRAAVERGLALWSDAAPEVEFTIVASSADMYIVTRAHCPHAFPEFTPGATSPSTGVVCIDTGVDMLPKVTAHEVGHAMGLPHLPCPSIMSNDANNVADAPTHSDVSALRALR